MVPLVAVSSVVTVAAYTGVWNEIPVVAKLSTYSLVAASEFCAGYATLLMYVLAVNITLPEGARFKAPVLEIVTAVPRMVLALTLPAVVTLPVALTTPPVLKLALVMFPVAEIRPPVAMFAAVMLPLADNNPVMLAPESQNSARRLADSVLPVKIFTVLPALCVANPKLPPLIYKYPSLAPNAV